MLIGYGRVSTLDQSPDLQVNALTKAGCERLFIETASGARANRPQLDAALDFARRGDTLVVWKLDRLGRSLVQLVNTLDRLHQAGVEFRSLTQQFDTTTPDGRLFYAISAAFAEFERSLIVERTKEGLANSSKKGGRPPLPAATLRAARVMLMADMSISEIVKQLGISKSVLYRHFPGGKTSLRIAVPDEVAK